MVNNSLRWANISRYKLMGDRSKGKLSWTNHVPKMLALTTISHQCQAVNDQLLNSKDFIQMNKVF